MLAVRSSTIALVLALTCAISFPIVASAVTTCPNAGERPATEADVPLMKSAGYGDDYAKVGNCWKPSSEEAGANVGEAKQYLRSILCPPDGDNYGGMGPDGTIQGLDGKFSICAAKFLKTARSAGIDVCIREGSRSVAKQNQYVARGVLACNKGARCEHPRGIAIDVNVRPNVNACAGYRTLHQSASQFGVIFYLGCRDAYHFVPLRGGNCNAGGVIQPDQDYDFPQYYTPQAPTSGISDQFRQALGMQPQQSTAPAPSASQPSSATTNLPQPTQSQFCLPEYKCSGNTLLFQNSFCATQVSQTCSAGCQNGACIAATSSTSTANTNTNTNTDEPTISTMDLLNSIGGGVSATSTSVGTATPLQLILGLTQNQSSATSQGTSSRATLLATGSIASMQIVGSQQTFVSPDLSGIGVSVNRNQNNSALFAILENMKNVLLRALEYLRPFRFSSSRASGIDGHFVE